MDENRATRFAAMLAIAAIVSACSTTDSPSASAGTAAEEANYVARTEKEEQLICRREQPTGSRISERICLTAEDWDKIEQQSQEMLNRTTRKAQQYEDQ